MNHRTLGKTGLRVSELGMGCSGIGRSLYRRDDKGAIATLRESFEKGVNFFDTAPGYSAGESERLIGKAFKGKRDQVIITSKVGIRGTRVGRFANRHKHLLRPVNFLFRPFLRTVLLQQHKSQRRVDFSRDFIVGSLEQSLQNLQADYLDVLLLHHPTLQALKHAEFRDTFIELKKLGKIRHWGISPDTIEQAMLCLDIPDVEVVQIDLSMVSQEPLDGFLACAQKKNVAVVAKRVLAQGLLTGSKVPTKADRWTADTERLKEMKAKADQLGFLATGGRTLAQSALLFIRGLEAGAIAMVGYSSQEHMREIIAAYDLPLLSKAEYTAIRAL